MSSSREQRRTPGDGFEQTGLGQLEGEGERALLALRTVHARRASGEVQPQVVAVRADERLPQAQFLVAGGVQGGGKIRPAARLVLQGERLGLAGGVGADAFLRGGGPGEQFRDEAATEVSEQGCPRRGAGCRRQPPRAGGPGTP